MQHKIIYAFFTYKKYLNSKLITGTNSKSYIFVTSFR